MALREGVAELTPPVFPRFGATDNVVVNKVLLVLFILAAIFVAGASRGLPIALQEPFNERFGGMLGSGSREFTEFQRFAEALVRADMRTVAEMSDDEPVSESATRAIASLRTVGDVEQVAYRSAAERPSVDGRRVTLDVSQGLRIGADGTTTGTMTCEARYEVTMLQAGGGWKVVSLAFLETETPPDEVIVTVVPAAGVEWSCADRTWRTYATAWKSTTTP